MTNLFTMRRQLLQLIDQAWDDLGEQAPRILYVRSLDDLYALDTGSLVTALHILTFRRGGHKRPFDPPRRTPGTLPPPTSEGGPPVLKPATPAPQDEAQAAPPPEPFSIIEDALRKPHPFEMGKLLAKIKPHAWTVNMTQLRIGIELAVKEDDLSVLEGILSTCRS